MYVSNKRNERAPDGDMCAECKVLHAPFRTMLDWNAFKDFARTPDGTKDIKEVSDNRKGSTTDFPDQGKMTEEVQRRLWIADTAEFTKLFGTPTSNRLPRAPSFTVTCETGEGLEPVWALLMGNTRLPLPETTPFQQDGASKHKLRISYDDCCLEAQGQLFLQSCQKAHLQSSGKSIMFKDVDLHTVQEYHDKMYSDKLETRIWRASTPRHATLALLPRPSRA